MKYVLSTNHWTVEDYKQVVNKKEAQEILRNRFHLIEGRMREFIIKPLGVEMYEVCKKPITFP